jgi:glycosyltransferase involved in cell wall biosynthesis
MASVTVIILTYNEEKHIARAITSCRAFAEKILVVDSFSTDSTLEIARDLGADTFQHPFENQAQQFQWALDNLPITSDWVMRLDADEIIEDSLAAEITTELHRLPAGVTGVNLKRKHVFLGRWVRHGGRYPIILLRIWRRGAARIEQRWMDEHVLLEHGKLVTFKEDFADVNLNDITYFITKHNQYATREAVDVICRKMALTHNQANISSDQVSAKVIFTRMVKERIYNKIPFQISSALYFAYRYFVQLGFLDGVEGSIYHVLQGFWYRYLVGAKTLEFERSLVGLQGAEALSMLERLSGLRLKGRPT